MNQEHTDHEALLAELRSSIQAGKNSVMAPSRSELRDVPKPEAHQDTQALTVEQQARHNVNLRRQRKRHKAVVKSFVQVGIAFALYLFASFYNRATLEEADRVFIAVAALEWISVGAIILYLIKTLWMGIRKAEDFDYH